MRVLIATPLYPPEPGGPATYVKLLEERFAEHGIRVQVVKFSDVLHYPRLVRHVAFLMLLLRTGHSADQILVLDPVSTGLPATIAALLLRKPLILKVVGDYAWEQGRQRFGVTKSLSVFVQTNQMPLPVRVLRTVQVWVARSARVVIVPSEYLKGIVQTWGIPEKNIRVIYNSISLEEGGTVSLSLRELPRPYVVSAGRLAPWKGMRGLIDAVALVRAQGIPLSLALVGAGPEQEALKGHARTVLREGYAFTGALNHADTLAVLKDADLFVLNSSYEGLSHLLIEALMLGKPIISTSAGGNTELIRHEHNGLLIDPDDTTALAAALARLDADQELRGRLASAAQASSERFSVDRMVKETAEVLATMV